MLTLLAFAVACGDDDPVIDIGAGGIAVADGIYISVFGEDPTSSAKLVAEKVEAADFGTQDREGYVTNYVFLAAGNYEFVEVKSREVTKKWGGTATTRNTDTDDDASKSDGNSGCGFNDYTLVKTETDGAAFAVSTAGLYKVAYDDKTSEAILFNVTKGQVIGAATPIGWSSDSGDATLEVDGTATADGVTFKIADAIMRPGEFKVRFGCRWKIDRRIDLDADPSHEVDNGYVVLMNFGGTLTNLEPGGSNFSIAEGEDGKYTVTAAWTAKDGFALTVEKTEALDPISFDPSDFAWAITGEATSVGWPTDNDCGAADQDIDLNYEGVTGTTYTWKGTFDLTAGAFKFRTNDCWDLNVGFADVTVAGTDAAEITEDGGNFAIAADATYEIVLTTSDEGSTWTVDFTKK